MPTPEQIVAHHEPAPDENPWVAGNPPIEQVQLVPYDPNWPDVYDALARDLRTALAGAALHLEHVGSTSVPGLPAKPVIDIDLTVNDPASEASYAPPLEAIGYRLTVREPSWHQHRCFRLDQPRVNLHVFGPDSPELLRHQLFRDWLRIHPDDRNLYARAKEDAIPGGGDVTAYNARKEPAIREIYGRVFAAARWPAPSLTKD